MLAPYDSIHSAAASLLQHYRQKQLTKEQKNEAIKKLSGTDLNKVDEATKSVLIDLAAVLSAKPGKTANQLKLLLPYKPKFISFENYEGEKGIAKLAITKLQMHYAGEKISKEQKQEVIDRLQAAAKGGWKVDLITGLSLQTLAQVLQVTNRGKKRLQPLLQSFVFKTTPLLPQPPINHLDEELGVVVLGSESDPISLEAKNAYREEQANFFLAILTRFLLDYPFSTCEDIHDISLQKIIAATLQPELKKIVETIGFPTPGETSNEEKQFIIILLSKFEQFLTLLNSSLQSGRLNKTILLLKINSFRSEQNKLPDGDISRLIPILDKCLFALLSNLLKSDGKNPYLVIALQYVANRLGKRIDQITKPNFVAALLKKLLNETLKSIEEALPLSQFKAPDTEFSAKVGNLLYDIFQKIVGLGSPVGCTSFAVTSLAPRLSSRENVGETFQQFLNRLAQSSSRLQLFYTLSLLFWKQQPELWEPYLNLVADETVNKEEISALIENKLSSIISIKTDETGSSIKNCIKKCASALVGLDGSLSLFQKEISKVFSDLLLNQEVLIYFIIFMLEGVLEHQNKQRNEHES